MRRGNMDSSGLGRHREISHWRTYAWGMVAALTCPCHLPLIGLALAGTSAGALLGQHWMIAAFALAALFLITLSRALRSFWNRT